MTISSNSRIAELEKKIKELNDQIRVYKNELSDKQKEFTQEKADLQLVIDQQKKGGEEASNAELNKVKKDLEKAQKELQEGAVEKERFQAQLEMLVQELEQKQVILALKTNLNAELTHVYKLKLWKVFFSRRSKKILSISTLRRIKPMILKTNIEPDFDLNLFQTSFSKMMYNISVAEKRVVSKEKQFLEVFCISRDNKVLSKCSYCPSHYLCSDLLSIWL